MGSWQQPLVVGAAALFALWLLVKLARGPAAFRRPDPGAKEEFRTLKLRARKAPALERAALLVQAGDLAREGLHRIDLGVAYYLRALRFDPTNAAALDSVRESLALQRNWKRLERAYWRLLARLPDDSPLIGRVLSHLADLYSGPFRHPVRAEAIRRMARRFS
jgi:hypothetical protein